PDTVAAAARAVAVRRAFAYPSRYGRAALHRPLRPHARQRQARSATPHRRGDSAGGPARLPRVRSAAVLPDLRGPPAPGPSTLLLPRRPPHLQRRPRLSAEPPGPVAAGRRGLGGAGEPGARGA